MADHQQVSIRMGAVLSMLNLTDPITSVEEESETKMGELIEVGTEAEANLSRRQITSSWVLEWGLCCRC